MAAVSSIIAGVAAGASLYQGYKQAEGEKELAEYQRAQYERNAQFAEQQAKLAETRGQEVAGQLGAEGERTQAAQRSGYAAQGVAVGEGSAAEIQASTGELTAQDIKQAKANAWREAFGYRVQAEDYRSRGSLAVKAAEQAREGTLITAGLRAVSFGKDIGLGGGGGVSPRGSGGTGPGSSRSGSV